MKANLDSHGPKVRVRFAPLMLQENLSSHSGANKARTRDEYFKVGSDDLWEGPYKTGRKKEQRVEVVQD